MNAAALAAFDEYTARLVAWARADERVVGVVLLGSGADRGRIDHWSDHDIAVIASSAAVEGLRETTEWIPDAAALVAHGREWHDGFKALFADGRVIEYAVTDLDGLASFPIAAADIRYDAGGVTAAVERARTRTRPRPVSPTSTLMAVLLVQLTVGVGRLRRGERLSGANVIRSEAAATLVDLILATAYADRERPDPFDAWRRFEEVDAAAAVRLDVALSQSPEAAARSILDQAERMLSPQRPDWPAAAAESLRQRFGWLG